MVAFTAYERNVFGARWDSRACATQAGEAQRLQQLAATVWVNLDVQSVNATYSKTEYP